MLASLDRILDRIANALMFVGGVAVTLMMLHIGADVIGKYFFNYPIPATLEVVAWYYMVATIFLPVAYIQLHQKHLMVELFTRAMPPRPMALLEGLVCLLGFAYVATLVVLTFEGAMVETENGAAHDVTYFDLPVWPSRWFLPAALLVMAIIMALQATRNFVFLLTGKGPIGYAGEDALETPNI